MLRKLTIAAAIQCSILPASAFAATVHRNANVNRNVHVNRTFTSIETLTSIGTFTSIETSTSIEPYMETTSSAEHTMATIGTAVIATSGMALGMHTASADAGSTLTACGSGTLRFALLESLDCGYRSRIDCI